jgi:hypothetical protein
MRTSLRTGAVLAAVFAVIIACLPVWSQTDSSAPVERTFPYSVEVVKKGLDQIGGFRGGKLPIIDGFVSAAVEDLDRYEQPYYQYRVQLNPVDGNTTSVKVEARISAWHVDREPSHSQYRSLVSNGRLETDLLDRLQGALGWKLGSQETTVPKPLPVTLPVPDKSSSRPLSANPSKLSDRTVKASPAPATPQEQLDALLAERQAIRERTTATLAEIERLKATDNTSRETAKLASIKDSGVGVMARKNFGGPVLFRAQAQDEFEVLSLEAGWVLVRLSEGSTGYVQADELNLPSGVVDQPALPTAPVAAQTTKQLDPDLGFGVSHEDVQVFSGEWERLRGKRVLFIYAQPRGLLSDMAGEDLKLAYVKRIFVSRYRSANESAQAIDGMAVVFLGTRGGVAAATLTDIRDWAAGVLGDEAFVNRCSLDPPAEFGRLHPN